MRFELTVPFDTTVFKTVAINRTLPHFLVIVYYIVKARLSQALYDLFDVVRNY